MLLALEWTTPRRLMLSWASLRGGGLVGETAVLDGAAVLGDNKRPKMLNLRRRAPFGWPPLPGTPPSFGVSLFGSGTLSACTAVSALALWSWPALLLSGAAKVSAGGGTMVRLLVFCMLSRSDWVVL